jgi:hypothetical protein
MKIEKFKYKKTETDVSEREVLVLNEDENHLKGLDLSKVSLEEKYKIIGIQENYEDKLKPHLKNYRDFIKEKIEYIREDKIDG